MFKTKDGVLINIEEIAWREASRLIKPVAPELVKIINTIDPDCEDCPFYKVSYPYGAEIIKLSDVFVPLANGEIIPFNDSRLPEELAVNLSYNPQISNPLGIILTKNSELYLELSDRIMPYMVISPGEMIGLARVLDNALRSDPDQPSSLSFSTHSLNAGSRSLFMLSKISDRVAHNKLKKAYNLKIETPKNYGEHWLVFKEIAKQANSSWRSEVLFFSNKFIEKLRNPKWLALYALFAEKYRRSYSILHNVQGWEATFSKIESTKHLEDYSEYTLDTAKHLFTIAGNRAPGYRPATNEDSAPVELIQEAYLNGYCLTDYCPTIMEPAQFNLSSKQPLYYSLSYATLPKYNPKKFKGKTFISLISQVQHCADYYRHGILSGTHAQPASLLQAASNVNFSFYHDEPKPGTDVKNSALIIEEDQRFVANQVGTIPSYCSFFIGCVKVSPNE